MIMNQFSSDLTAGRSGHRTGSMVAGDDKNLVAGTRGGVGRPVWPFLVAVKRETAGSLTRQAPNHPPSFSS
ncbi:hypothetical protein [Polaromonas sp.]|uniref:hypothetical protein n=1 Tax=Polaromonas sp. TaxID=1869339 RepID=UPI0027317292|nr:hypothetical protein [Polaromonas sp.]MDP1888274.1 hypothetical protein [Polaromonas sp.]